MKAKEFGEPQPLPSQKEERGYYYFFDVNNWRRERVSRKSASGLFCIGGQSRRYADEWRVRASNLQKEFILNYDHLHHAPSVSRPMALY